MQLEKIKVVNLYGTMEHTIPLFTEQHITVLIGQNGVGKTLLLRMVKAFFDLDFGELNNIDFDQFILFFEGDQEVQIQRKIKKPDNIEFDIQGIPYGNIDYLLVFKYFKKNKLQGTPFTLNPNNRRRRYRKPWEDPRQQVLFNLDMEYYDDDYGSFDSLIRQFIPDYIRQIEPNVWYDSRRRENWTTIELLNRFSHLFPKKILEEIKFPEWLKNVSNSIKVRFVETQRLLNKIKAEDGKYNSAVIEYSREITETIKTQRALASDLASKLDRTYPKRILERFGNNAEISTQALTHQLTILEQKRAKLNDVGLIDTEEEYIPPFLGYDQDTKIKNVLKLYIDDSNRKLEIYEDLSKRISLFLNIINGKFLQKTFKIDKETGFKFISDIDGKDIPLSGLSSGEQHELVLFYKLLFNTTVGTLLLIDEPEISLHISWQKKFIQDLIKIIKINPIDIIIATHSPDIISNYWDLAIQLNPAKK